MLLSRTLRFATLLAALLGGAVRAEAQVVSGRVLEAGTQQPVASVLVTLVDSTGLILARSLSAGGGEFVLQAPRSGFFRLRTEHFAYAPNESARFGVLAPDTVQVILHLSADPIALPALEVLARGARPDARLDAWGFYARQSMFERRGAYFFTADEIEQRRPAFVSDLLRDVHFLHPAAMRSSTRTRRGMNVPIFLNGALIDIGGRIDAIVSAGSVVAIEVYPAWPPAEFICGRCDPRAGAVVIWTGLRTAR